MAKEDVYRTVTFKVIRVNPRSIIVEVPSRRWSQTVARSLLHGADDMKLGQLRPQVFPQEMTVRLMEWKAEELSLA